MRNFIEECRHARGLSQSELAGMSLLSTKTIGNMEAPNPENFKPPSQRKVTIGLNLPLEAIRYLFPKEYDPEKPWAYYVAAQAEYCEENEKPFIMPRNGMCEICKHGIFAHPSMTMIDALTRRIFECPRSDCGHPFVQDDE